ncbi:MAG: YeeE/YedE family protein, partial [Deltaproteobacteria bacterium]
SWRAWFVLGLVAGGLGAAAMLPHAEVTSPSLLVSVVAGALVGVGTRLGNGCTSGHGVCGLSRLSGRSLVATLTFITTGAIAVLVMRGLGAGEAP